MRVMSHRTLSCGRSAPILPISWKNILKKTHKTLDKDREKPYIWIETVKFIL
jgi:hypothetical protein